LREIRNIVEILKTLLYDMPANIFLHDLHFTSSFAKKNCCASAFFRKHFNVYVQYAL